MSGSNLLLGDDSLLLPIVAASAAAAVTALAVLQTDYISRRILAPARLDSKRRSEYQYHWKIAMEKAHLQLDWYLAGGQQQMQDDHEIIFKHTEYLSTEHDLDSLIHRIIAPVDKGKNKGKDENKEHNSRFFALKIDRDPHDTTGEFYLFLLEDVPDKGTSPQLFQVPLMPFGMKLAQAFEDKLTTTTLCFVADASAGKATSLLEHLVTESKTGVAVWSEPLWMVELARLAQAQLFSATKIKKLLFGLCRMDAWSLRDQTKDSRTVMITLPGQSTVSTLLPLLQEVFPEDRHVFAYDGCVASVQRGIAATKVYQRDHVEQRLEGIIHTLCHNPIRHTTPLPSNTPLTKTLFGSSSISSSSSSSSNKLETALSQLSFGQAQGVEAWMSSVDTFFKLKQDDATNGYLPYVLKLGFLTNPKDKDFTPQKSDSFWSLSSCLQYITGCRSRPLPEGVLDAAAEFLKDYNHGNSSNNNNNKNDISSDLSFSDDECTSIENCVFQHKSILIGNKTFQDTVLPTQHWTLKQASKKGGCACCGPDPFDEEEEEEARRANNNNNNTLDDMGVPGAFAMASSSSASSGPKKRTNFVDGKLGFAFDPSRFS